MKKRFLAYLEIDEETLLKATDRENIIDALQDEFSWAEPHGVTIKSIKEHDWLSCTAVELPLYVRVLNGRVTDISYYSQYFNQGFGMNDIDINVSYEFTESMLIDQEEICRLEEEIKPHREQTCQCHQQGNCTCSSEVDSSFSAEGWHCVPEFQLQAEIDSLRNPH